MWYIKGDVLCQFPERIKAVMQMEMFLNDNYKLLKLLYDNQTTILDKKVVPLTQEEVCSVLNMSKVKVNSMFVEFQKGGLLVQETSLNEKVTARTY